MKPVLLTAAGNLDNQDRGIVIHNAQTIVLCVADGAGGRSGGLEAAIMATDIVRQNASALNTPASCSELLQRMDDAVAKDRIAGETTCALAVLTSDRIYGASVGDSGIWLISEEPNPIDLARGQQRKPFIGSGSARAIPFDHPVQRGFLLLATDGLLKYADPTRIRETCRQPPIEFAAQQLIELVRYRSGDLPDDVTVILTKL